MTKLLKTHWPLILLIVLTLATRFWQLGYPPEVVFDEVHFGKFVSSYFTGEYYFDIHPPLGKLMIAGVAKTFGYEPGFGFERIGKQLDRQQIFILRILPAFFGALFVIIIYLIGLEMRLSRFAAFLAAFFVLFDNALLVESKFVLVDLFLLCFGFLALYFFLRSRAVTGKKEFILYGFAALFAGLAVGIKFTGISFAGIILLFSFIDFIKKPRFKKFFYKSLMFVAIAGVTYIIPFYLHFSLLTKSGPGNAFMSAAFQKNTLNFWNKFLELNKVMYTASANLTATHPDGSTWSQWPLGGKPIYYWTESAKKTTVANIYLIGNLFVWWLVLCAIAVALFSLCIKKLRKKLSIFAYLFLAGYFANLLPFVMVKRVAFLYHYLPSLIFGVLLVAVLLDSFFPVSLKVGKKNFVRLGVYGSIMFLTILTFAFLVPITYGIPVSSDTNTTYQNFLKKLH